MSHEYRIISGTDVSGSYDVVALLIKIRNGSISADTRIQRMDSKDVKLAKEWDELKEFFTQTPHTEKRTQVTKKLHLSNVLHNGIVFLQQHMMSTVYSSCIIMVAVISILLVDFEIDEFHIASYAVAIAISHFLLSCYLILILRMVRGQATDVSHVVKKIAKVKFGVFKLLFASFLISLPIIIGVALLSFDELIVCVIGLMVIILPGMYVLTIYCFVPLLIVEYGYGVLAAMETSRNSVLKGNRDNFGVYFALNAVNFIAGLLAVFPMALTLPVTMSAIAESYDELFS